eukprot:129611_1
MKLLLDFHYSHWWADPNNQWDADLTSLKNRVYKHTRAVMEALIAQNTIPQAIQIGNEVNSGMLWDQGRIVDGDMSQFVDLTNSAVQPIHESIKLHEIDRNKEQIEKLGEGKQVCSNSFLPT